MFKSKRTMAENRQIPPPDPPTNLPPSKSASDSHSKLSSIFLHLTPPTLQSNPTTLTPQAVSRNFLGFQPILPQAIPTNLSSRSQPTQPLANISNLIPDSEIYELSYNVSDCEDVSNREGDLLRKIEIVDKEGIVERTTTRIKAKDVFKMPSGLRIKVYVNSYGQLIRAARDVLTRYMTKLVKQPNLCPPDLNDFHEVKDIHGVELLRVVREKFSFTQQENVDKVLIALFDSKYRQHKHKTRRKLLSNAKARLMEKLKVILEASGYQGIEVVNSINSYKFTDAEIEAELDEMEPPPGFAHHQWLKFKMNMKSEKAKELSKKGKEARAAQTHIHTTGTKSYAQVEDEYVIKHKVEPGPVKLFELTHKKKDGSYVQDESREFMVAATSEIAEIKATRSYDTEKELESEVWYKLMGEDNPGQARGYGIGVTKSQVTGFNSHLKKMRSETTSRDDSPAQMQKLQSLLSQQQQKILEQQEMMKSYMIKTDETISSLRDEVQIYRTAFGSFVEDKSPTTNERSGVFSSQDPFHLNRGDGRENNTSPPNESLEA